MDTTKEVTIIYINYKGITRPRNIIPEKIVFKSNKWHNVKQWLLHAYDVEKRDHRTFAMKNILAFRDAE